MGIDHRPAGDVTPRSEPAMLAVRGSSNKRYQALPGTLAEVDAIERMVVQRRPEATVTRLSDREATESGFARLAPQHRYLHVATHGFFAPPDVVSALAVNAEESGPTRLASLGGSPDANGPRLIGHHPDLLSGLVFAGANRFGDSSSSERGGDALPSISGEDGILTAADIQELDLRGVELEEAIQRKGSRGTPCHCSTSDRPEGGGRSSVSAVSEGSGRWRKSACLVAS